MYELLGTAHAPLYPSMAALVLLALTALGCEKKLVGWRTELHYHQHTLAPYFLYGVTAWLTGTPHPRPTRPHPCHACLGHRRCRGWRALPGASRPGVVPHRHGFPPVGRRHLPRANGHARRDRVARMACDPLACRRPRPLRRPVLRRHEETRQFPVARRCARDRQLARARDLRVARVPPRSLRRRRGRTGLRLPGLRLRRTLESSLRIERCHGQCSLHAPTPPTRARPARSRGPSSWDSPGSAPTG